MFGPIVFNGSRYQGLHGVGGRRDTACGGGVRDGGYGPRRRRRRRWRILDPADLAVVKPRKVRSGLVKLGAVDSARSAAHIRENRSDLFFLSQG